jgi:hypothetical protein
LEQVFKAFTERTDFFEFMFKKYLHHHVIVATHSRAEIRNPMLRVTLSLLLAIAGGYIGYRVIDRVWLNPVSSVGGSVDQPFDAYGMFLLSPLWIGAICMIYMAYLLLFASARRARKGFLPPIALKVSGILIVMVGVYVLIRGNVYGAFVVAVGGACFGLARDRKDFIVNDNEWL